MGNCFSCHKKLGLINNWRNAKTIQEYGYKTPEGMSKQDKLCRSCLDVIVNTQVKKITESTALKEIQTNVKVRESTKSIKIGYYLNIVSIIGSSLMTINGLTTGDTFTLTVGVIFLIISLIQFPKRKKQFDGISKTDDGPLTALKLRLAKGEITKEEFDKIKEDLKD